MTPEEKPNATLTAVVFSGLSLIMSLGYKWDVLVRAHKWSLWSSHGWFAVPGSFFNIAFVVIAVISIIVAFCNREQKKITLWLAILMLIPGIIDAGYYFLFFWAVLFSS